MNKLLNQIYIDIDAHHGKISFARYMEMALYTPGLGYYSAGATKLGENGDFVTAPEISSLFGQCIAKQCEQVLQPSDSILELGAGTGKMAVDILKTLQPKRYYILEVSADLKERQQQLLQTQVPELYDRIEWLSSLPEKNSFSGIIVANEVLDALPVHRFRLDKNGIQEIYVRKGKEGLEFCYDIPSSPGLLEAVKNLQDGILKDIQDYESEIHLSIPPLINSLADSLHRGLMLFIDYGFPAHEYYHPDRNCGTLMCHHQHRSHENPLILPGEQDITAHVDFTAVAYAAVNAGLQVKGYTDQASFLLGCGLMNLAETSKQHPLKLSQEIQKLTMPHQMGELFKVIGLTKGLDEIDLMGFSLRDKRTFL